MSTKRRSFIALLAAQQSGPHIAPAALINVRVQQPQFTALARLSAVDYAILAIKQGSQTALTYRLLRYR